MKVLFICSGNSAIGVTSNIKNQEIWLMTNFNDLIIEYYLN